LASLFASIVVAGRLPRIDVAQELGKGASGSCAGDSAAAASAQAETTKLGYLDIFLLAYLIVRRKVFLLILPPQIAVLSKNSSATRQASKTSPDNYLRFRVTEFCAADQFSKISCRVICRDCKEVVQYIFKS
jgi:hypothetical protein